MGCSFLPDGIGVEQDGVVVFGSASQHVAYTLQFPNEMCVSDLAECLKKLAGVEASMNAQKWLANRFGREPTAPAIHEWLERLLREDDMVDSFREFHPQAEERFTCWDQYKNKRFENIGSRIDYFLVDRPFFEERACKGADLQAHGSNSPDSAAA